MLTRNNSHVLYNPRFHKETFEHDFVVRAAR